jgi:hypothetical protein
MIEPTKKLLRDPSSELVFGLVVPVGADLERLEADLIDQVGLYGYLPSSIRLGALLRQLQLAGTLHETPELARIKSYIKAGNTLREQTPCEEALVLWAMGLIKKRLNSDTPVLRRTTHIQRSIKHPDEARALRGTRKGLGTCRNQEPSHRDHRPPPWPRGRMACVAARNSCPKTGNARRGAVRVARATTTSFGLRRDRATRAGAEDRP